MDSYDTQEIFSIEVLVALQKMKKQLVVCGDTEKVDPIMAVVMQTWYLRTGEGGGGGGDVERDERDKRKSTKICNG